MSKARCSLCRHSDPDGTAAVYAATVYPSGLRLAHRFYICGECVVESLVPLIKKTPLERIVDSDEACVLCDTATADDPNYYWFTIYPPHGDRSDHEALLCFKCHALTAEWISFKGRRLPDRPQPAREALSTNEAWAFLAG